MVTSGAVPLSTCVVYDGRREARGHLARMLAEVPGVRRLIPVASVEGLLVLAGEPGHVVVIGTPGPASGGVDVVRAVLASRSDAVILVVGSVEDARPASAAVAAGAVGFVRWDASPALVRTLVDSLAGLGPSLSGLTFSPASASPADGRRVERPCSIPSDLGISRRELEVLDGIGRGLSNRELSRKLDLSENTIKSHVRGLFSRLGVHERAHAVARAYRLGLFVPEGDSDRSAALGGRGQRRVPKRSRWQARPAPGPHFAGVRDDGGARAAARVLPGGAPAHRAGQ
jgi:two-component system nitrate/nitrite response regulator NarL